MNAREVAHTFSGVPLHTLEIDGLDNVTLQGVRETARLIGATFPLVESLMLGFEPCVGGELAAFLHALEGVSASSLHLRIRRARSPIALDRPVARASTDEVAHFFARHDALQDLRVEEVDMLLLADEEQAQDPHTGLDVLSTPPPPPPPPLLAEEDVSAQDDGELRRANRRVRSHASREHVRCSRWKRTTAGIVSL